VKGESPVTEKIIAQMSEKIKTINGNPATSVQMGTVGCSCGGKC